MRVGVIWRVVFADSVNAILHGAHHPEGRFHHTGQPAFYGSPDRHSAASAVASFCTSGDAPRCIVGLHMRNANLLDLRDAQVCADLGITTKTPSVPWQPERAAGRAATSWQASDAARASGADGIIYAARSAPDRWHVALFRWNLPGSAQLRVLKDRIHPFTPPVMRT